MAIRSINPTTGEMLKEFEPFSESELNKRLEISNDAFKEWGTISLDERAKHMFSIAKKLHENVDEYAELLTTEMGKTFEQAKAEVEKSALNFEHYGEHSASYLCDRKINTDGSESFVTYEPLGVILTIMPWNFAFWQALRMAAPILMAGNTVLLKHASNVPQAALLMEKIMLDAGMPEGVFQTLLIETSMVKTIIENDYIKGVSLTGSEKAGSIVGAQAGKEIKPVVLELGGSDPSIILEDCDLESTCETIAKSRLQNNGQSCIGSKRFIVLDAIYDEFLKQIKSVFESYIVGDPMDPKTMIGPIVSEDALNELLDQIKRSVDTGAKILTGGKRMDREGYFMEPTILIDVTENVPSYSEELFGPVVSIIRVKDDDEAISVANDTRFGLGASIYTKDIKRAKTLVPRIEAGCVFINGLVKSDPRMPFGGIKRSGIGRELSEEGIREFTNIKSVWIK